MAYVEATAGGYEGPEIPDGYYELTCKEVIDVKLSKADQFGKTEKFRIVLEGVAEGVPFTVEPLMNQTFSAFPGRTPSTLFVYAEAFGCNPDPSAGFDTDEMIGKKLRGLVETAEEPGSWPRVQKVSQIKGQQAPARQAAPAASTEPTGARPSPLKPDGTLDTNAFWFETRRLGMSREAVVAEFNGDVENIVNGDPLEVADWLLVKQESLAPV